MTRILAVALLLPLAANAERWRMQYFYDEDRSSLTINDLSFPSAQRGVAVGYISEKNKRSPKVLVTSDGGANWTLVPLKEIGISLFFLDESHGWMVTQKGLWQTEEAGRSWHKLPNLPPLINRVHFLDKLHGWAVGARKSVYETKDGGKKWQKVPAAEMPKSNPEFTSYTWITFANPKVGMITGWNRPPRRSTNTLPDWVDPESARSRREWPTLSLSLETRNGGQTWKHSTASMFGSIVRVRLAPDGRGLGLINYLEAFDWPSEVFELNWHTGKMSRGFRDKNRLITDVMLPARGPAYLAGIETLGELRGTPIPGKVKILKSNDLLKWTEMEVDYRATASRVLLAGMDDQNIWAATSNGMIMKLVQ